MSMALRYGRSPTPAWESFAVHAGPGSWRSGSPQARDQVLAVDGHEEGFVRLAVGVELARGLRPRLTVGTRDARALGEFQEVLALLALGDDEAVDRDLVHPEVAQ